MCRRLRRSVTGISGVLSNTYAYDLNGNMTNRDGDTITWYSFNLPKKIHYGADSAEFWYGTDRSRYKQVAVNGGTTVTTRYVGDHFEVEERGTLSIYRHYIRAGGEAVAQYERRSDGSNPIHYPPRSPRQRRRDDRCRGRRAPPLGVRAVRLPLADGGRRP